MHQKEEEDVNNTAIFGVFTFLHTVAYLWLVHTATKISNQLIYQYLEILYGNIFKIVKSLLKHSGLLIQNVVY